ncbi:RNA-directed DNA polymerase, eukaryota, reverse transcriptase zinc-binding domain protein [Tanacetum coccineum]
MRINHGAFPATTWGLRFMKTTQESKLFWLLLLLLVGALVLGCEMVGGAGKGHTLRVVLGKDGKPMRAARCVQIDATKGGSENVVSLPAEDIPNSSIMKDVNDNVVKNDGEAAAKISFASILQNQPSKKTVKITKLYNNEVVEGAAIAIPLAAVEEVSSRFTNTLYGYFIGKRLAFPLVENYVKNTWAKKDGMESVKLHHVPIVAYSEIGLSLITTQIGRPIMLDSYTSNMCLRSWGRNAYARALIEVSAEKQLMEEIVITVPYGKEKGHSLATIKLEYDWKPPRCDTCKIFDHKCDQCPKNVKVNMAPQTAVQDGL